MTLPGFLTDYSKPGKGMFGLDAIGPGAKGQGPGSFTPGIGSRSEFTKIAGDKIEPVDPTTPDIKMTAEAEKRLILYLDSEINIAKTERQDQMRLFARLKKKYKTKFPEIPKDWPMANSSQLTVPIIKTAVNTLSARVYQTVMAADPQASIRTKDPLFKDVAFDFEDFLKQYSEEKLDIDGIFDNLVTEVIKLGTGVLEVSTKVDKRKYVRWDPASGQYTQELVDKFNGPAFLHFPIEDFWCRAAYQDIQDAPWCGKFIRLPWSRVKDMALSGEIDPKKVAKLALFTLDPGTDNEVLDQVEKLDRFNISDRNMYGLFNLNLRWDVDGDGIDEEITVWYHHESRTLLRKRFSGFRDCKRPWIIFRFINIEHRLYGEGLAEMLEHLQEEISTIHNQRIDNATVANLQIVLVRRMLQGLRPGDRLWSGKIVKVTDVHDDVGTLRLGEIYPSTVSNEAISQGLVRELSGIGEAASGTAQPVSRTTAAAQLALLEELNRRFDKILRGFRRSIRQAYTHLSDLFLQQGTGGLAEEWLGMERGSRLEAFLRMPADIVTRKVKIQVLATRNTVNREVEFQSAIAVMNLIIQHGQQALAITQQFAPNMTPVVAHELVKAIRPVFKKVMQYADAPSADEAASVLAVLERILPAPESMGMGKEPSQAQQALPQVGEGPTPGNYGLFNGPTAPEADERLSRMEALLRPAGGRNGSGRRVPKGRQ